MARGSGFGALGKNFIIVGNAQHRIFGLRSGKGRCACEKLKKRCQILGRPSQAQFQPQLRDGSLLMTTGQHRAEAQRMRRAGRGARGTKRSPSAGAVGKIARLPTEAFHVDSRFTAWSHSRPGSRSPSFRQLNDALCDRYRGRIFADDQPEPSQRSFEARRHTRDVFWPKRMIAFEKGSNWHIRP